MLDSLLSLFYIRLWDLNSYPLLEPKFDALYLLCGPIKLYTINNSTNHWLISNRQNWPYECVRIMHITVDKAKKSVALLQALDLTNQK